MSSATIVGVIIVIYVFVDLFIASYMEDVAQKKGYDGDSHVWAISFWLGLPGWLYTIALPDLVARENQQKIIEALINTKKEVVVDENDDELPDL